MPKSCCVPGCTASKTRNFVGSTFYILPTEEVRRKKWLVAINRARKNADNSVNKDKLWSPKSIHTYVCSAHFLSGRKVNDRGHPDYVPSVFSRNQGRSTEVRSTGAKLDRYKRRQKRDELPDKNRGPKRKLKFGHGGAAGQDDPAQEGNSSGKDAGEHGNLLDATGLQAPLQSNSKENIAVTTDNEMDASSVPPMDKPLRGSERQQLYEEMNNLRKERDEARAKVVSLEEKLKTSNLSASSVEGNDEACKMMTGISWDVFMKLFLYLREFLPSTQKIKSLSPEDQLFLTLVRLKHDVTFDFLARLRGIPKTTMIDHFWKWIELLHSKISFMVNWCDRDATQIAIPPVFKEKFPRLTSIIDCFEIFIDAPRNLLARAKCYSSYKKHCTIKFLISCSPLGAINFVSRAWGGRATDNRIVRDSGFISSKYHLPGDQILADRGFLLQDDFAAACGAELLLPAFKKKQKQLSAKQVETSRKISSVRIHIERVIGLLKNRYTILKGPVPIQCVNSLKEESLGSTLASCDKIITVCSALVNLGEGIIFP